MSDAWPTLDQDPSMPPWMAEYAGIWRSKKKVVFSTTMAPIAGITVLREVDPAVVNAWKREPGQDMSLGLAEIAATFMAHDLIDEYELAIHPVILGGGKPMFGAVGRPLGLRLIESRVFGSKVQSLRYERVR